MKQLKLWPVFSLLIAGFTMPTMAQVPTLPEVTVVARNYKYLKAAGDKDAAQPVKMLQWKAASYNVKNSEYYEDDYDNYFVSFYLPEGYILAVYDSTGKLIRTAERFKDIALPSAVATALADRFPNWRISEDIYRVKYEEAGGAQMVYKVLLRNGNKRLRVKANEKGEFF
jgi:hypothetical protein